MTDSDDNAPLPPMLREDAEATLYKYRDFASVPEDHDGADPSPQQNNRSLESSIRVQKFPVKLYAILAQKEFSDIITWMPHGRSWKVLKPNLFESLVMPLFFEYSNYHSFNRLVNAWSFRRISSGPDRGSYYHELFLRGKPHLQKYMRRLPKTHKKLPMKKQDEPDFYKLDKSSPLPDLDETSAMSASVMALRRQPMSGMGQPGLAQQNQAAAAAAAFGGFPGGGKPGDKLGLSAMQQNGMGFGGPGSFNPAALGQGFANSPGPFGGLNGPGAGSLGGLNGLGGPGGFGGFAGGALGGVSLGPGSGFGGGAGALGGAGPSAANYGSLGGSPGANHAFPFGASGSANYGALGAGLGGAVGSASLAGAFNGQSAQVGGMAGLGGMGGMGAPAAAGPVGSVGGNPDIFQLQRLRHLQHLQMFQRQIGAASVGGVDDLARLQSDQALSMRGAGGPKPPSSI